MICLDMISFNKKCFPLYVFCYLMIWYDMIRFDKKLTRYIEALRSRVRYDVTQLDII